MKIIDNFLDIEDFANIKNTMLNNKFSWFYQNNVSGINNEEANAMYFTHIFYHNFEVRSDKFYIFNNLLTKIKAKALIRIKGNCYPRTDKLVHHKKHTDYPYKHQGLILYINDNDGFTILGDKKIESKENRALFFDPSVEHNSTNCTDKKARFNININYYE
tara:strand:+ start:87 stop:569 length:483 start_codon:yes stop_codon:yes gene_type:complete